MLPIELTIEPEKFDEGEGVFIPPVIVTIQMEHSLVSISEWEKKYNVPFLSQKELTDEQTFDYIKFMTVTPNVDPKLFDFLTPENVAQIKEYIQAPMTATTFSNERSKGGGKEIITSELIYYWMIALQIPVEFQYWHLNRLITLIKICNIKNDPPKKMSKRDVMSRNAALNAQRRAKLNSKG